jgi:zinc protease
LVIAGFYTPRNLVLCAVGDFREAELRAWVEALLGGEWGRPCLDAVPRPAEPMPTGRRLLLRQDDVKEAYLRLGFHLPDISHPDVPVLDVLAMMLGQGEASRQVRELKRQRGLTEQVSASAYTPRDPGLFSVGFAVRPERLAAALEGDLPTRDGAAHGVHRGEVGVGHHVCLLTCLPRERAGGPACGP